jgi:hypothetical protein
MVRRAMLILVVPLAIGGCLRLGRGAPPPRWSSDLPALVVPGATVVADTIARGVLHRAFSIPEGPWTVHVLDVDRRECWAPVALKGAPGAAGRFRTSALASGASRAAGAVNADFFLFAPPGVPTGAHVSRGRVITGPGLRPVFAVDSAGRAWLGVLSVTGVAVSALDSIPVVAWNRASPVGLAWFDAGYGAAVDTATGTVRVVLSARRGLVLAIDTTGAATPIPSSGGVLVLGARVPTHVRERFLLAARSRGRFEVTVRLEPFHAREAVGGFPILVRDSAEVPGLDSAGAATFAPVRHPRTIVGVTAGGRRLLLITVDGRQAGHSAGTTNRESARLALQLGATEAINLDGGGSTTMAVARERDGRTTFEVVNRPSDPQGERAVGNALAVVKSCG